MSLKPEELARLTPEKFNRLKLLLGASKPLEWYRCAGDKEYWFDSYAWTYNPKLPPSERWIKFVLFPKQREYLGWRKQRRLNKEDGVVVKSRDVGLTWLNIADQIHSWIFEQEFAGGFGSATEEKLDRIGDPGTILEKGRLLLDRLPEWMLPVGYDRRRCCGFKKFLNPENGSVITGECGDNIGRGGRTAIYDVDEAAFVEHANAVEAALSQNTNTVIWTSTVNGVGNLFHTKATGGKTPVFIFDWRDDPRKDQAWYDKEKERFAHDPALLASEVDHDFTASLDGIVIPGRWVSAAIDADKKIPGLTATGQTVAASDIAAGGSNKTVFGARSGPIVGNLEAWNEENTTRNAHRISEKTRDAKAVRLNYDANGIGIGCKSTWELEVYSNGRSTLGFGTNGILGGSSPTEMRWPDGKSSKELFANYRAEIAWQLRERFRKTWERIEFGTEHPLDELVCIPNHPELILQLSTPLMKVSATGKKLVESKEDMRKRGVVSPDWFDMLMYLFAPTPPPMQMSQGTTHSTQPSYAPAIQSAMPTARPIQQPSVQNGQFKFRK